MSESEFGRRELFRKAAVSGAGIGLLSTLGVTQEAQAAIAPIPTRTLGATGEQVPILLMGGSQKFDPTYDRMLHRAFKEGLFYLDTAESYANGQSHVTLAPFIEQVGRENLWITSKVMLDGRAATPANYRGNMEKSIGELGTDWLDMFFFHGLKEASSLEPEFIQMADKMKKDGFTKFFGFSCHDGNVVELMNKAAKIGAPGIDAIMFAYNFTKYGDLELNKAMDACLAAGIGLLGMKTQTSVPEDKDEVKNFVSENFSLAQAKLKAAWADERLSACVSGINNINILKENVAAAKSTVQLSMNEYMQLNQYAVRTASSRCQGCSQICEANVEGDTKIAYTLRYLMYYECYGDEAEAKRLYRALAPAEKNLAHDFADATRACPQGIDIQKRLNHAANLLA